MDSQLAASGYRSHITPDKEACKVKFIPKKIFFS
jgi:hypothetical protein